MPNSNPVCEPPSDFNCADGVNWAEIYPELCLETGSESVPLTAVGLSAWDGGLTEYSYILMCSSNRWLLEQLHEGPNGPIVDNFFATGGSIPNLIFPGFSTSAGEC